MYDWIEGLIDSAGYLALAVLMLLQNVFPPTPSEVVLPVAGFRVGQGLMNLAVALVTATAGSLGRHLGAAGVGAPRRGAGASPTSSPPFPGG